MGLVGSYDVIHIYLMVDRGYELIVYTIFWVIKDFPKCWHEVMWWLKVVSKAWYVDVVWSWLWLWFNNFISMKRYYQVEIGAINLLSHIFFMKCLNVKRDRHSLNMYFIRVLWYWWWVWMIDVVMMFCEY